PGRRGPQLPGRGGTASTSPANCAILCAKDSRSVKAPGSRAIIKWPRFEPAVQSWYMLRTAGPNAAPVNTPTRTSTMRARAYPLGPAIGRTAPSKAFLGSVVGLPSASIAHPSGIGLPVLAARMMFPLAVTLVERSMTTWGRPGTGIAAAIGFVPKYACRPPQGGMPLGELVNANPIIPRSAASSQKYPAAPKWLLLWTPATAAPD